MVKPAHRPCGKSKNRGKYKVQVLESIVPEKVEPEREFNALSSAPVAAPRQPDVPRKLPVNGKTWKPLEAKRASAIHKSKKTVSWDKKQALRQANKEAKEQQRLVEEMQREERREEHRRRLQRQKQKEENEKKTMSFQVIKDPSKIKKMSKKQLRFIQKADTLQ